MKVVNIKLQRQFHIKLKILLLLCLISTLLTIPASSFAQLHSRVFVKTAPQCISFHHCIAHEEAPNILQSYASILRLHPLATKSCTAAILVCTGDAIAQSRSSSESYDNRRGMAFVLFGASYTGLFQHYWFSYLSEHIASWGDAVGVWGPERVSIPVDIVQAHDDVWWRYFDIVSQLENPPSPTALAIGKLIMNQFVVVPIVYMPLFFAFTGLISGLDVNQSIARGRSLYFPILKRNYFYWLPVQFFQFLLVPMDFQIPFVSAASLIWTIVLSSIGGGSTAPTAPASIIAYETEDEFGEEIVMINKVESGPANTITDDVLLEDVTSALIPDNLIGGLGEVTEGASFDAAKLTTGGFAAGLIASAANEAIIGEAVGELVGAEVGVGVAVVAAAGAGIGLLAANLENDDTIPSNTTNTNGKELTAVE